MHNCEFCNKTFKTLSYLNIHKKKTQSCLKIQNKDPLINEDENKDIIISELKKKLEINELKIKELERKKSKLKENMIMEISSLESTISDINNENIELETKNKQLHEFIDKLTKIIFEMIKTNKS